MTDEQFKSVHEKVFHLYSCLKHHTEEQGTKLNKWFVASRDKQDIYRWDEVMIECNKWWRER